MHTSGVFAFFRDLDSLVIFIVDWGPSVLRLRRASPWAHTEDGGGQRGARKRQNQRNDENQGLHSKMQIRNDLGIVLRCCGPLPIFLLALKHPWYMYMARVILHSCAMLQESGEIAN